MKERRPEYIYIPHIELQGRDGQNISLIDHLEEVKIQTPPKTAFTVPGYPTTLYLEDPVTPGGHVYWYEITRNNERPLERAEQVSWVVELCKTLEEVRSHFGDRPLTITSAYRPPAVNAAVGGALYSQHIFYEGAAVDFYIDGVSEYAVYDYLHPIWDGGLAIKPGHFCHLDNRPGGPSRWNY